MHTALLPVPLAPEISLHLAEGGTGLFDATGGEFRSDTPPPFWAFVWAGGQALARYVLDHPETVAGRRVLDAASGSGVAAIAAALAGAASVEAVDLDPAAARATSRNAAANGVSVRAWAGDLSEAEPADVILAGDVFYTRSVADHLTAALRRAAASGTSILVGDPGRGFFPERLFVRRAEYPVPVPAALEDTETLVTAVWEMRVTRFTSPGEMLSPTNKL